MHENLLKIIRQKVSVSDRGIELCHELFEPVLFPKNRIIEEEGKIPNYLYFVVSGYMRLFHYNEQGDEITSHINCPPGFITSYFHFINQTTATENVECITACDLLRINKKNLNTIISESEAFKSFSILVFQQALTYNETRSKELASLSSLPFR